MRRTKTAHRSRGTNPCEVSPFANAILIPNAKDGSELAPKSILIKMEEEMSVFMHDDVEINDDEFLILYQANRHINLHA